MREFDISQFKHFFVSVCFHLVVCSTVVITFPNTKFPVKPQLVFWGSFLGPQDMAFSGENENLYQRNVDARTINMDVRRSTASYSVGKPEPRESLGTSHKVQFKPLLAVNPPALRQESRDNEKIDESFAPIAPVKMKLITDDKN